MDADPTIQDKRVYNYMSAIGGNDNVDRLFKKGMTIKESDKVMDEDPTIQSRRADKYIV